MTKSFIVLENIQEYFVIYIYHNIYIVIEKNKKIKKNCNRQSCKTSKQANKQKNKLEAL